MRLKLENRNHDFQNLYKFVLVEVLFSRKFWSNGPKSIQQIEKKSTYLSLAVGDGPGNRCSRIVSLEDGGRLLEDRLQPSRERTPVRAEGHKYHLKTDYFKNRYVTSTDPPIPIPH